MGRLKIVFLAVVFVAIVSLAAGCVFIAERRVERPERHVIVEHPEPPHHVVTRLIIVDDDYIRTYGAFDLYIDGRFHGRIERRTEIEIEPGEHNFRFERHGYSPYSERLVIRGGEPANIRPRFKEDEDRDRGRGNDNRGQVRREDNPGRGPSDEAPGQQRKDNNPGKDRKDDNPGKDRKDDNPGHDRN